MAGDALNVASSPIESQLSPADVVVSDIIDTSRLSGQDVDAEHCFEHSAKIGAPPFEFFSDATNSIQQTGPSDSAGAARANASQASRSNASQASRARIPRGWSKSAEVARRSTRADDVVDIDVDFGHSIRKPSYPAFREASQDAYAAAVAGVRRTQRRSRSPENGGRGSTKGVGKRQSSPSSGVMTTGSKRVESVMDPYSFIEKSQLPMPVMSAPTSANHIISPNYTTTAGAATGAGTRTSKNSTPALLQPHIDEKLTTRETLEMLVSARERQAQAQRTSLLLPPQDDAGVSQVSGRVPEGAIQRMHQSAPAVKYSFMASRSSGGAQSSGGQALSGQFIPGGPQQPGMAFQPQDPRAMLSSGVRDPNVLFTEQHQQVHLRNDARALVDFYGQAHAKALAAAAQDAQDAARRHHPTQAGGARAGTSTSPLPGGALRKSSPQRPQSVSFSADVDAATRSSQGRTNAGRGSSRSPSPPQAEAGGGTRQSKATATTTSDFLFDARARAAARGAAKRRSEGGAAPTTMEGLHVVIDAKQKADVAKVGFRASAAENLGLDSFFDKDGMPSSMGSGNNVRKSIIAQTMHLAAEGPAPLTESERLDRIVEFQKKQASNYRYVGSDGKTLVQVSKSSPGINDQVQARTPVTNRPNAGKPTSHFPADKNALVQSQIPKQEKFSIRQTQQVEEEESPTDLPPQQTMGSPVETLVERSPTAAKLAEPAKFGLSDAEAKQIDSVMDMLDRPDFSMVGVNYGSHIKEIEAAEGDAEKGLLPESIPVSHAPGSQEGLGADNMDGDFMPFIPWQMKKHAPFMESFKKYIRDEREKKLQKTMRSPRGEQLQNQQEGEEGAVAAPGGGAEDEVTGEEKRRQQTSVELYGAPRSPSVMADPRFGKASAGGAPVSLSGSRVAPRELASSLSQGKPPGGSIRASSKERASSKQGKGRGPSKQSVAPGAGGEERDPTERLAALRNDKSNAPQPESSSEEEELPLDPYGPQYKAKRGIEGQLLVNRKEHHLVAEFLQRAPAYFRQKRNVLFMNVHKFAANRFADRVNLPTAQQQFLRELDYVNVVLDREMQGGKGDHTEVAKMIEEREALHAEEKYKVMQECENVRTLTMLVNAMADIDDEGKRNSKVERAEMEQRLLEVREKIAADAEAAALAEQEALEDALDEVARGSLMGSGAEDLVGEAQDENAEEHFQAVQESLKASQKSMILNRSLKVQEKELGTDDKGKKGADGKGRVSVKAKDRPSSTANKNNKDKMKDEKQDKEKDEGDKGRKSSRKTAKDSPRGVGRKSSRKTAKDSPREEENGSQKRKKSRRGREGETIVKVANSNKPSGIAYQNVLGELVASMNKKSNDKNLIDEETNNMQPTGHDDLADDADRETTDSHPDHPFVLAEGEQGYLGDFPHDEGEESSAGSDGWILKDMHKSAKEDALRQKNVEDNARGLSRDKFAFLREQQVEQPQGLFTGATRGAAKPLPRAEGESAPGGYYDYGKGGGPAPDPYYANYNYGGAEDWGPEYPQAAGGMYPNYNVGYKGGKGGGGMDYAMRAGLQYELGGKSNHWADQKGAYVPGPGAGHRGYAQAPVDNVAAYGAASGYEDPGMLGLGPNAWDMMGLDDYRQGKNWDAGKMHPGLGKKGGVGKAQVTRMGHMQAVGCHKNVGTNAYQWTY